jgi:glycosyltransferase involved in cell wall biosynthesis
MSAGELPVSAVIPAYQAAEFLTEAIASVRAQTRPPAEIVVVDDGSTDATADIARAAGTVVVRQANAGPGAARNAGALAASRPWIAYLDADDLWLPEKLDAQWSAHLARPAAGAIVCDSIVTDGGVAYCASAFAENPGYRGIAREPIGGAVWCVARAEAARRLPSGNFVQPSTLLVRRSLVLDDAPFPTDAELRPTELWFLAEDLEWALRALRFTDLLVVERPLVRYRRHARGLSASAGRMRYGDVKLGDYIARNPERYPAGVAASFRAMRGRKRGEAARAFLRAREPEKAAIVLRESLRDEPGRGDALLLAVARAAGSTLGRRLVDSARTLWRRR